MKVATWNVNSLRVRLDQVVDWLSQHSPDIVGLQETKLPDHDFPADAFLDAGYDVRFAGQKTYNGVALAFRHDTVGEAQDLIAGFSDFDDSQKRVLGATFGDLRVLNLYVPNGQRVGSEKFDYKLRWLAALERQLQREIEQYRKVLVMGDFNIAPEDRDVHDPERWRGKIMCSDEERRRLAQITGLGVEDLFRRFEQDDDVFSWWDYRMGGFERNNGLRIDLIVSTAAVAEHCTACQVDIAPRALDRPSDHAPVWASFVTDHQ